MAGMPWKFHLALQSSCSLKGHLQALKAAQRSYQRQHLALCSVFIVNGRIGALSLCGAAGLYAGQRPLQVTDACAGTGLSCGAPYCDLGRLMP